MSKQTPKTPEIAKCAKCGADAKCIDWDFDMRYRVFCDNNHIATGRCNTEHRAIMKWNNNQQARNLLANK